MADIRAKIDRLDRHVISLIGERFGYVKAASKFKTGPTAVAAPERFQAMLTQRRIWATDEGLNPNAIEKLYTDLVGALHRGRTEVLAAIEQCRRLGLVEKGAW
jgi:isochorismate pyruvate lyase